MQRKILEFANLLRQSGLRVSVSEAIDAFQALGELSLADRDVFRDALRVSLVKRGDDIATYDQLFDLYWSGFYDNLRTPSTPPPARSASRASTSSGCSSRSARCSRAARCRKARSIFRSWRARC